MLIRLNIPQLQAVDKSNKEFLERFLGFKVLTEPVGQSKTLFRVVAVEIESSYVKEDILSIIEELLSVCRRSEGRLQLQHEILLFLHFYITSIVPESVLPD